MLWTRNNLFPAPLFDADGSGNAGGGGGSGSNGGSNDQDPLRQFKQSELDAMFGERAKQARSAAVTDLLKDLGVENADQLKAALKRLSTIEEQGKTDTQKLTDQVAALQKQIEAEKASAAEQVKAATLRLMQAEVVAEAAKQGVRADAVSDVWVFVDRDKITENEGKFEGVKEAVEAVVKAKAYLLDQKKQGNGQGTPDRSKHGGGQTQQNQSGDQKAKTRPITL